MKKKTSHPTFNEILRVKKKKKKSPLNLQLFLCFVDHVCCVFVLQQFKIPLEVLKTQNLNLSVWHNDMFGRNSFLGEVDVDLSEWDFGNTQINEYMLQARV